MICHFIQLGGTGYLSLTSCPVVVTREKSPVSNNPRSMSKINRFLPANCYLGQSVNKWSLIIIYIYSHTSIRSYPVGVRSLDFALSLHLLSYFGYPSCHALILLHQCAGSSEPWLLIISFHTLCMQAHRRI